MGRQSPGINLKSPIPAIFTVMRHASFQVEPGLTCQIELRARLEIHKGGTCPRLKRQIAQGHKHRVADVIGNDQHIAIQLHKSRIPSPVACIMISVRVFACDEECVGLPDHLAQIIGKVRARSIGSVLIAIIGDWKKLLDVLRTIRAGLRDIDYHSIRRNLTHQPIYAKPPRACQVHCDKPY